MQRTSELSPASSKASAVLTFLLHQVIATVLILVTATWAVGLIADFLKMIGLVIFPEVVRGATRPPYSPAKLLWALFLGWSLGGFLRHRVMFWVWVIPALIFGFLYFSFPYCPVEWFRNACLDSPSARALFFGKPCTPLGSCMYQMFITFPFLASAAYSAGALIARRMNWLGNYAETMAQINMARVCSFGAFFIAIEVFFGWRYFHRYTLPVWYLGMLALYLLTIAFVISTYFFMVVIALIGRRTPITRWFLNEVIVPASTDSAD
jgi:hypothetical protein